MYKEVLTVEYLPAYTQYRLWNSEFEGWFPDVASLISVCKDNQDDFRYVTYGTPELIADFEAHGVVLETVGKSNV